MDRPRFEADERIDQPDVEALSSLADRGQRDMGNVMGAPNIDPLDGAYSIGATVTPSSIAFASPNMTIGKDLRVLLSADTSALVGVLEGDGPRNGDLLELTADTPYAGGAPTAVLIIRYLLARPSLLTQGDNAQRVFYQLAAPKEFTKPIDTRWNRSIQFLVVDSIAAARAQVVNGFQLVCKMDWNHGGPGVPGVSKWYGPFQDVQNAAYYPSGHLTSVSQAVRALAVEVGRIKGTFWDTTLPGVQSLANLDSRVSSVQTDMDTRPKTVMIATFAFNGAVAPTDGGLAGESYNANFATAARSVVGQYSINFTSPLVYVGNIPHGESFSPYAGFFIPGEQWLFSVLAVTTTGVGFAAYKWGGAAWALADPAAPGKMTLMLNAISA